jgi:MFS family permease
VKIRLSRPWLIASLGFFILGFTRGIHSSFGVLYVALLDTHGWSRALTASVFSLAVVMDAVVSPLVGHLIDRFGVRRIAATGTLILSLGLLLTSQVNSLWQFYVFFGLVTALGFSFTGMIPHVVLISEWFSERRGSAIGLVYAGSGTGILILAPFIQWLIGSWSWAVALQVLSGLVFILVLPLVLLFYGPGPHREWQSGKAETPTRSRQTPWTLKTALKSVQFWALFFARINAASGTTVIVTHQVAHVVDIGYSGLFAATVFGLMGLTSSFGRMVFGLIADSFSKQAAYTANIFATLVGVGALILASHPGQTWLLYVYVVCFGIGFGSRAVIFSALTADIFAGKKFGAILGYFTVSVGVGGALGSWLGGFLHDVSGSYVFAFLVSVGLLAMSDLCVWLASSKWISKRDKRLLQNGQP